MFKKLFLYIIVAFSAHIQQRKIELTFNDIQNAFQPYGQRTHESAYPSSGTWGNLCKDLQIPNITTNRIRLKNACLANLKVTVFVFLCKFMCVCEFITVKFVCFPV